MKIALAAITKGDVELKSLKRMVVSVEKYVDGVYITTNGKHDKTKKWLESKGFNHSHLDWDDDFSAQRNFNFSQVPEGYDFIFWLDSDDVLIGGQHLQEVAQITKTKGREVAFLNYWYGCEFDGEPSQETFVRVEMDQKRERLIKPGVMKWKKRLHETPIPNEGGKYDHIVFPYGKENPIAVMHLGASTHQTAEQNKARNIRNQRILERQLDEERENGGADPRTLLYLMKIYAESDKQEEWEQCILMGAEYLKKSGWNEERAVCCILVGRCYGYLGDNDKATRILHEALANYPYLPTVYLRLSEAYFNKGMLPESKHWLELGLQVELPKATSMTNILEVKYLAAALSVKLLFNHDHDTKKAYEAAVKLAEIEPNDANLDQLEYLEALSKLDDACRRTDHLTRYLEEIEETQSIVPILDVLPEAISAQPFAQKLRHKYMSPRKWGEKEICYFANFGGKAFEPWGPKSLEKGLGGSETAVIMLSKEWAKKGYKVTVYGDPEKERGTHDGVTYLPWYYFNPKDHFNILIVWRNTALLDKVKAKKVYLDLHDIFFGGDLEEKQHLIDKVMVKSYYHRSLAKDVPDEKFKIISNGIL